MDSLSDDDQPVPPPSPAKKPRKKRERPSEEIITQNLREKREEWEKGGGRIPLEERKRLQDQAIGLLLTGLSVKETAAQIGVDVRKVYKWMQSPSFRAKLDRSRSSIADVGLARLTTLTAKAITALEEALQSPNEKYKIIAARVILSVHQSWEHSHAIKERIAELERSFGAVDWGSGSIKPEAVAGTVIELSPDAIRDPSEDNPEA